jgi:hypothetical protein
MTPWLVIVGIWLAWAGIVGLVGKIVVKTGEEIEKNG